MNRNRLTTSVLFGLTLAMATSSPRASAEDPRKVVIPFDFVSEFDDGRYGRLVAEMIWKKLDRDGRFIIPESMLDVRDTCNSNNRHPTPKLSPSEMSTIVREDFGAHVGIWGSVERAPGHQGEVYDLVIKCVDYSDESRPRIIYDRKARTKSVSEIPHLYVKQMLDALFDRKPATPLATDPQAERAWQENPNLAVGDFQQGEAGVPAGWEAVWEAGGENQRQRLGRTVRWIPESGRPANRVVRFTFDAPLGDTTGVAYSSKPFPVEAGAKYRFQCRWRSTGPLVKVFVKGYAEVDSSGGREVYRSQQNLKGPKNTWNTHTEDFTPKHTRYTPRWGRVMLYAYLGGGAVEFDDVTVKQIDPASPSESNLPNPLKKPSNVPQRERRHEIPTTHSDPPSHRRSRRHP